MGANKQPESGFILLQRNAIGSHRSRQILREDDVHMCCCAPSSQGGSDCDEDCLNRLLNIECLEACCQCGPACSNQRLQRQEYAKTRVEDMGTKGKGLRALEFLPEGTLVAEYTGEVVSLTEARRRALKYEAAQQRHTYIMNLSNDEVIDATQKGGYSRFINHSCSPCCRAEKWLVAGEVCIAIIASRDVAAGEELTYDYRLEQRGNTRVRCECGALACRGFLGSAPRVRAPALQAADRFPAWDDIEVGCQADQQDDFSSDSEAAFDEATAMDSEPELRSASSELLQISDPGSNSQPAALRASAWESDCHAVHGPAMLTASCPAQHLYISHNSGQSSPEFCRAAADGSRGLHSGRSGAAFSAFTTSSISIGSCAPQRERESSPAAVSSPRMAALDTASRPSTQQVSCYGRVAQMEQDCQKKCAAATDEVVADACTAATGVMEACCDSFDPVTACSQQGPAANCRVADLAATTTENQQKIRSGRRMDPRLVKDQPDDQPPPLAHEQGQAAWLQLPWCHYHVDHMMQQFEASYWALATSIVSNA